MHEPLSLTHTLPHGFIQACVTTASNYHTHHNHSLTEIVKAKSTASYYGEKGCNVELQTFLPVEVPV